MDIKKIDIGTLVTAEFEAYESAVILTLIKQGKKTKEGFVLFGGNHLIDVKQLKAGQRVELEFAEGGPHGGHWRVRRLSNKHKSPIDPTLIISPPELTANKVWDECEEHVKKHGIDTPRGAAGADPGLCSCPNCQQDYWCIGHIIQCTECGFKFPTDAWAEFSWGAQARARGDVDYVTKARVARHPYFAYGYNNTFDGERREGFDFYRLFKRLDWKNIVGDVESVSNRSDLMSICERCGKTKEGRRQRSTEICIECEAQTQCRHFRHPDKPMVLMDDGEDVVCEAGVSLLSIAGEDGRISTALLPCYHCHRSDAKPVKCGKFQAFTIEELKAQDDEWDKLIVERLTQIAQMQSSSDMSDGESWTAEATFKDGELTDHTIIEDASSDD